MNNLGSKVGHKYWKNHLGKKEEYLSTERKVRNVKWGYIDILRQKDKNEGTQLLIQEECEVICRKRGGFLKNICD